MKKAYLNQAMMATRTIIKAFWKGQVEMISDYLYDDVVAIGPLDGEFYHTKEQVYETIKFLSGRCFIDNVTNQEIYPIVNELHTCVIVGHFVVSIATKDGKLHYVEQSLTLVWQLKKDQLKICHVHYSIPHPYAHAFDVVKPSELQQNGSAPQEDGEDLISIKDDQRHIRFLSLSAIEYAKAEGHETIIHTLDETIRARMRWKEFLQCLDDHFLQVHRSYVIKKESVKLIGKNYLELYSGERVPVSAKNVHEIVQALTKSK